jgi:hypothetical protein
MISPPLDISKIASTEDDLGQSDSGSASAASTASARIDQSAVSSTNVTLSTATTLSYDLTDRTSVRNSEGYSQFMEPKYSHDYNLSQYSSTMEE